MGASVEPPNSGFWSFWVFGGIVEVLAHVSGSEWMVSILYAVLSV